MSALEHSLVGPEAADGQALVKGAREHLDYLRDYWGREALWQSWSDFGRCVAAVRLGCAVEGVLPTTNHLESFNGVFKRKHLKRWQHYGKPLCLDIFIHLSITKILLAIFQQRTAVRAAALEWEAQIASLPGG